MIICLQPTKIRNIFNYINGVSPFSYTKLNILRVGMAIGVPFDVIYVVPVIAKYTIVAENG